MCRHRCRPPLSRTVNRTNIFWGTKFSRRVGQHWTCGCGCGCCEQRPYRYSWVTVSGPACCSGSDAGFNGWVQGCKRWGRRYLSLLPHFADSRPVFVQVVSVTPPSIVIVAPVIGGGSEDVRRVVLNSSMQLRS